MKTDGQPDDRSPALKYLRWPLFAIFLALTAIALALDFLKVVSPEISLFVAGIGGGAVLSEIAAAFERRDNRRQYTSSARQNVALIAQNTELQQQVEKLRRDMLSISEPTLAACVDVGVAFAQRNIVPNMPSATVLEITSELADAHDVNDTDAICKALKIRHGESASESFMLGRQLTLVAVSDEINATSRALIGDRLMLRLDDTDLARAVDAVLELPSDAVHVDGRNARSIYVMNLIMYLQHTTTTKEGRSKRARLLLGLDGVSFEASRSEALWRVIAALVKANIGGNDAELMLFRGIMERDDSLKELAMAKKADPSVTDRELVRRYRTWLLSHEPQLYQAFMEA
jgi:hypothetical protein